MAAPYGLGYGRTTGLQVRFTADRYQVQVVHLHR
jgi:hypothetical protein